MHGQHSRLGRHNVEPTVKHDSVGAVARSIIRPLLTLCLNAQFWV